MKSSRCFLRPPRVFLSLYANSFAFSFFFVLFFHDRASKNNIFWQFFLPRCRPSCYLTPLSAVERPRRRSAVDWENRTTWRAT